MIARSVVAPFRVLVALAVMLGLLAAAPAACWCPPDDHVGQLLHPRFDHVHPGDAEATFGHAGEPAASLAEAPIAPAWTTAGALGMSEWQGGVQIATPLLAARQTVGLGPRVSFEMARPAQHLPSPPRPPPR